MRSQSTYSVPRESQELFHHGILENPLMKWLPEDIHKMSKYVHFEGADLPMIPVNWRWAESISALKAFEATMLNCLLTRKYGISPVEVTINTCVLPKFLWPTFVIQLTQYVNVKKDQVWSPGLTR